ncbi:MAG: transcription termination factor NusA [Candidatus Magasanikbacteria bacterium]|nr:transcription termination factor NusA [Candidatus Magasanikbacteria bacterium]
MASEIMKAIQALCEEKNLSLEVVMETIEAALAAAYRKDFGNKQQNIKVRFDPETAGVEMWDVKTAVEDIEEEVLEKAQEELFIRREKAREEGREMTEEEVADLPHFNPKTEIMMKEAKEFNKKSKLGDILEIPLEIPHEFGRMAAQTAKQVIIQKIREAERNIVFGDFKEQEGKLVIGTIQRVETRKVLVDMGKVTGVLLPENQVRNERYRPGAKMKFYIVSVAMNVRGPEIILSRTHENLVKEIFRQEIPEISEGSVEIKGLARDPGYRSKVAVSTDDKSIDPIGSCIGQRGGRINIIIEELNGEKIDVIKYSDDAGAYISNAMAPAKISSVILNDEEKTADVSVPTDQFSLAIGRSGQNVRLASILTGWKINVKDDGGTQVVSSEEIVGEEPGEVVVEEKVEEVKEKVKEKKVKKAKKVKEVEE